MKMLVLLVVGLYAIKKCLKSQLWPLSILLIGDATVHIKTQQRAAGGSSPVSGMWKTTCGCFSNWLLEEFFQQGILLNTPVLDGVSMLRHVALVSCFAI